MTKKDKQLPVLSWRFPRSVKESQPPVVKVLNPSWWFVPYEQWLFDLDFLSLEASVFRRIWLPVLRLREYPGFDGSVPELRIYCPPSGNFVPIAMRSNWPPIMQRHAYAGSWETRLGPGACNRAVNIMSLQWERANRPPAIPYSIRELPWVSAWLAGYERL